MASENDTFRQVQDDWLRARGTYFNHTVSGIVPEYIGLNSNIACGDIVDTIQYLYISCLSDIPT